MIPNSESHWFCGPILLELKEEWREVFFEDRPTCIALHYLVWRWMCGELKYGQHLSADPGHRTSLVSMFA